MGIIFPKNIFFQEMKIVIVLEDWINYFLFSSNVRKMMHKSFVEKIYGTKYSRMDQVKFVEDNL